MIKFQWKLVGQNILTFIVDMQSSSLIISLDMYEFPSISRITHSRDSQLSCCKGPHGEAPMTWKGFEALNLTDHEEWKPTKTKQNKTKNPTQVSLEANL